MTVLTNTQELVRILCEAGTQLPENQVDLEKFFEESLKDYEVTDEERRALQRYVY